MCSSAAALGDEVEIRIGDGTSDSGRVGGVEDIVIRLDGRLDIGARHAAEIAQRYGTGGNGGLGHDAVRLAELCGVLCVLLHGRDGGGVLLQEGADGLRIGGGKIAAYHHAAHRQHALVSDAVPFLRQIQRGADCGILHGDCGGGRYRQHTQVDRAGGHLGDERCGIHKLDRYVLAGGQAILGEDIIQHVFGIGALAGGIDGASGQIADISDGIAVFQNIEHAVGIEGAHLHAAVGLVVEIGSDVGGDGGDIKLTAAQPRDYLIIGGSDGKVIIIDGITGVISLHQADCTHAGGAAHHGDIDIRPGKIGIGICGGAAAQSGSQHQREQKCGRFFHSITNLSFVNITGIICIAALYSLDRGY